MATENITEKNIIKSWFKRGLKPLELQFHAWMDSYWHKSEKIPTSSVENLETVLNNKAEEANVTELGKKISEIETAYKAEDTKLENTIREETARAMAAEDGKVDMEEGKQLSTEDYSTAEKAKLGFISEYVEYIEIENAPSDEDIRLRYHFVYPDEQTKGVAAPSIPVVTDSHNGVVSPRYKRLLDGLSSEGKSLDVTGTPSDTWHIGKPSGVVVKKSGNVLEVRNSADSGYADVTLNGLTVKGNMVVEGESFVVDAQTVETADNVLLLNRGEVGAGVTKGIAGLEIDRGTQENYKIVFDESDDRFKAGVGEDRWPLMLRDEETDLVDGSTLIWNVTDKRAKTGKNLDAELAKYLPLTGGTLTGKVMLTDGKGLYKASGEINKNNIIKANTLGGVEVGNPVDKLFLHGIYSIVHVDDSGQSFKIWDSGNHGINSGLDADLLDGKQGSEYALKTDIPALSGYATQDWVNANTVTITGPQTITGAKTFSSAVVGTAGFYDTSDRRLKKDIKPVELKLEKIKLYEFDKNGKHSYGVIAQDIEDLYPSTVQNGDDGYKIVNYNEILIIKCAELDAENFKLRERLDKLEKQLTER